MANKLFVTKGEGDIRKDNVALIRTQEDVPANLADVVKVEGGKIYINACIEGNEICTVDNFIAWEIENGQYNVWYKDDGHDVLYQKDKVWYQRPTVVKYARIDWACPELPDFAAKADIDIEPGKVVLHASWGDQTAEAPAPYAILGYANGSFALLKLDSESARQYKFCTEDGKILEALVQ